MNNTRKKPTAEALIVFIVIMVLSALLSGYLVFRVQFERRKEAPEPKAKELSYQTLRIKEQERKQKHEHFHPGHCRPFWLAVWTSAWML